MSAKTVYPSSTSHTGGLGQKASDPLRCELELATLDTFWLVECIDCRLLRACDEKKDPIRTKGRSDNPFRREPDHRVVQNSVRKYGPDRITVQKLLYSAFESNLRFAICKQISIRQQLTHSRAHP